MKTFYLKIGDFMVSNVNYEVINSKCHSILGRRLSIEDYKKLLAMKTVKEIAQYIKSNTDYGRYFTIEDINSIHRDYIERELNRVLIYYIDKFDNYFSGEYRDFFMTFYLRYEIYDLKKVARMIYVDGAIDTKSKNLIFVDYYKNIDVSKVTKVKSMSELIETLSGTVYYPYLKNILEFDRSEILFRFEMALDKAYFVLLLKKIKKLSDKDKKAFLDIFAPYIDMMNIQWIYRGKKFYNLSPEELFNYCIEGYGYLNYVKLKELCYSKSLDEFEGKVRETDYSFLIKDGEDKDIYMERRMNRRMYYKLKLIKSKNMRDISLVLSLIELIELEIRDIVSITEIVRYSMGIEEAKNF